MKSIRSTRAKKSANPFDWSIIRFLLWFVCGITLLVVLTAADRVKFGSDFSLVDNVLRVRTASTFFTWIFSVLGSAVLAVVCVYLIRRARWTSFEYEILIFIIVWSTCFIGFHPFAQTFPSFVRSPEKIEVHFDDGTWYVRAYFDARCIAAVEVDPKHNDLVMVKFHHVPRCHCWEVRSWGDNCGDSKKIATQSYCLKANRFPFDAGVLAYAIVTGKIDMSKQGFREGVFSAIR